MSVTRFTINDPTTWYQAENQELFVADVLDEHNSATMSVGFARYARGAWNDWTLAYDEALIITKGVFSVQSADGIKTARPGEVLFLTKGTKLVYRADADTELVYVTYPHWADATRQSAHVRQLDAFHPVRHGAVAGGTGVALSSG